MRESELMKMTNYEIHPADRQQHEPMFSWNRPIWSVFFQTLNIILQLNNIIDTLAIITHKTLWFRPLIAMTNLVCERIESDDEKLPIGENTYQRVLKVFVWTTYGRKYISASSQSVRVNWKSSLLLKKVVTNLKVFRAPLLAHCRSRHIKQ